MLRALIASSMLSKVADWQFGIVIPLAVLAESGSAAIALVSYALRGVTYVGSPFLGAVIDRYDKRTVFLLAQFQQVICLVLLTAFLHSPTSVAVLSLISGFGGVASTITGQFVLIPKLISEPARPQAVGKLNSAIELSKIIGMVVGGVTFTVLGATGALLCIAGLYFLAGATAALLPAVPSSNQRLHLGRDLAIGFRWVAKPEILWLVVTMSMTNLAIGGLEPALVTELGEQGVNSGLISVVMAVGLFMGVVSSRLAPTMLPSRSPELRILLYQVIALAGLVLVATPVTYLRLFGFMVECFAVAASNVASITYRQEIIPVDVAGRVNATVRMFITGAAPLSVFLFAWTSGLPGLRSWLPSIAIWVVAIVIWAGYTRHGARTQERATSEGAVSGGS
ncbi:MFS transporter [Streptomyces olivaceus]|uniref:MFS transporter n=1 Tax=Streptomyces olivaceus TaxID=47716 RepID=UPI001CC94B8B|nr:MFS transporter [Streptomyces olivaceus]MBZ6081328.1 MFS transporter [Streptomyces olivaceus]